MTTEIHITILLFLTGGLLVSGLIKNYHFELFHAKRTGENLNTGTLISRILSGRIVGLLWVFPFRINEGSNNVDALKHKRLFAISYAVFISFWILTILYATYAFYRERF